MSEKMFSLGPVESFSNLNSPHSRDENFIDKLNRVQDLLIKTTFSIDSKVITLSSSGSGAMEAAVISLFDKDSKVLILNSGTFGNRFVEICKFNNIPYEEIKIVEARSVNEDDLRPFEGKKFDGILAQADETSTGILHDVKLIGKFAKESGAIFVCDAISSYLCDYYNASEFGVDVTILSSQKALALPIGASFVILNKRAQKALKNPNNFYLNLKEYLVDELNIYNLRISVPTFIIEMAYDRLVDIDKKGVEVEIERVANLATDFREKVSKIGDFSEMVENKSNAMTYLRFHKNRAQTLHKRLLKEYNMFILPIKDEFIKVGHMGNITLEDNRKLIENIEHIVSDLK